MLIHVFDDTPHHYKPMQVFFSKQCQIKHSQKFWARQPIAQNKNQIKNKVCSDYPITFYHSNSDLISRLKQLPSSAKIVFHGLFELHIWRRLVLLPITKNCSCIFWGAELYRHGQAKRKFKHYIAQLIHSLLISRFQAVKCLNSGDAELVGKYLKRKKVSVLPYPLIGFTDKAKINASVKPNRPIKILVGNSAAPSNEHSFALAQLSHLANEHVEIIVPLNYGGNADYIASVIAQGKAIFADKFIAYTEMLDKTAYDNLLTEVDLAVFAHNRQQGLYVAYAMLCQGKPMYLKQHTSSFLSLSDLGFFVQPTEQLDTHSFVKIQQQVSQLNQNNKTLMNNHFTEAALAPQWSDFLNGLLD